MSTQPTVTVVFKDGAVLVETMMAFSFGAGVRDVFSGPVVRLTPGRVSAGAIPRAIGRAASGESGLRPDEAEHG
jgi:hypothetical protein